MCHRLIVPWSSLRTSWGEIQARQTFSRLTMVGSWRLSPITHPSNSDSSCVMRNSRCYRGGPTLAPCSAPTVCLRVASPKPRDEGRNLGSVRSVGCTEVLGQETLFLSNLEHHADDKQPQPDNGGNRVPC